MCCFEQLFRVLRSILIESVPPAAVQGASFMTFEREQVSQTFVESVIVTQELIQRAPRPSDLRQENLAFHELAGALASDPVNFLEKLVEVAARLCRADSVGISVAEIGPEGEPIFRWIAVAGELKDMVGGTISRDFSPCGVCVDTRQPLLISKPHRVYPQFNGCSRPVVEALLIPWGASDGPIGTLWVVAHSDSLKFDLQDVRIMSSLAGFACGAIQLQRKLQQAERIDASLRMTASMAHHINNPLQGALLALYRLRHEGDLSPKALEVVAVLEEELNRVTRLSSELLQGNSGAEMVA